MTKKELIGKYAAVHALSQAEAGRQVNGVIDLIVDELMNGGDFKLTGLFALKTVQRGKRKCKNPQTGEEMTLPAHKTIALSVARSFREAMNAKKGKGKKK